jgi:hypothetical protein
MVFLETYSYRLGLILGDIILMICLPTSSFIAYKSILKVSDFASSHSISKYGPDFVSKNLFDCLLYMDSNETRKNHCFYSFRLTGRKVSFGKMCVIQ